MNAQLLALAQHFCLAKHDLVNWDAITAALTTEIDSFVPNNWRNIKSVVDMKWVINNGGGDVGHFIGNLQKIAFCLEREIFNQLDDLDLLPTKEFKNRIIEIIYEHYYKDSTDFDDSCSEDEDSDSDSEEDEDSESDE